MDTILLNSGMEVLAKNGSPVRYANISQARKAIEKLGHGWHVRSVRAPFYVVRTNEFDRNKVHEILARHSA
jgi:hypothetical protein